jgi:hypothetical protein
VSWWLRVGSHWSTHGDMTTVVRIGDGQADAADRRPDDELVGVMKTPEMADLVCRAVNAWLARSPQ